MPRAKLSPRPYTEVARESSRKTWCRPCRASDHRECIAHPDDDGFGAACRCPCEGEITESQLLIDLVATLRAQVEQIKGWAADFAEKVVIDLNNAFVDERDEINPDITLASKLLSELDTMVQTAPLPGVVAILGLESTDGR